MKIKKFDELNENLSVRDQLLLFTSIIRKTIPTFDFSITGNYGEIRIDGSVKFHTNGPHSLNFIMAYVSGMVTTLMYKK